MPQEKRSRLTPWLLSQTAVMAPISFSYFATFLVTLRFNPSFYDTRKEVFSFLCCCCCLVERKSFPQSLLFPVRIERQQYAVGCCCLEKEEKKGNANNWPLTAAAWCFWPGKWWWRWTFVMTAPWSLSLSFSLYITVHYPAAISTLIVKSYIAAGSGDTLLSLLFPSRLDRRDSPTGRRESQYNLKLKEGEIE